MTINETVSIVSALETAASTIRWRVLTRGNRPVCSVRLQDYVVMICPDVDDHSIRLTISYTESGPEICRTEITKANDPSLYARLDRLPDIARQQAPSFSAMLKEVERQILETVPARKTESTPSEDKGAQWSGFFARAGEKIEDLIGFTAAITDKKNGLTTSEQFDELTEKVSRLRDWWNTPLLMSPHLSYAKLYEVANEELSRG